MHELQPHPLDGFTSPDRTASLHQRSSPLVSASRQRALLEDVDLSAQPHGGSFDLTVRSTIGQVLTAAEIEVLQINVGKLCNMSCRHCHVDAGPDRQDAVMSLATAEQCLSMLDQTRAQTVDITGGAPELNPSFRLLVDEAVRRGKHVIDRCNLTVLHLEQCRDLPDWLADREVEVVASLPHPRRRSTDAQRGEGTYQLSIEALRRLNRSGYGRGDQRRCLTLMANPVGAFLAGDQQSMEREWHEHLQRTHGVSFDRLILLNNMPIARYLEWLTERRNLSSYLELLVASFNPATVASLMCLNTISVSWDGRLFDCDFNQMLDLEIRSEHGEGPAVTVADFDPALLHNRRIRTGRHCFGCTAGAGSSCGGALA